MTLIDIQDTLPIRKRLKSKQEVGLELASRDIPVGIDAINLWYPTRSRTRATSQTIGTIDESQFIEDLDWLSMGSMNGLARLKGEIPLSEDGGIKYGYKENVGRDSTMWLEIYPSRVKHGPKSLKIATIDEVKELLLETLPHLFEVAEPSCRMGDIRITRLDLTRDVHDVAMIDEVIRLSFRHLGNGRLDTMMAFSPDGERNSITRRKSDASGPCIYNKTKQSGKGNSVLRFEFRFGKRELAKKRLTIEQFTEATISELFFDWADPIAAGLLAIPDDFIQDIICDGKERKLLSQLIGDEVLRSKGYPPPNTKYGLGEIRKFFKKYPLLDIPSLLAGYGDSN